MIFLDKIGQLKVAYEERDIDIQLDVVEDLLFSQDKDIIFHTDCALADKSFFMKYAVDKDIEMDDLREDLDELVECLLEYGDYLEGNDYIEDYEEECEYEDNILSYYKEFERLAFGKLYVENYIKGIDYQEIDDDDLDY